MLPHHDRCAVVSWNSRLAFFVSPRDDRRYAAKIIREGENSVAVERNFSLGRVANSVRRRSSRAILMVTNSRTVVDKSIRNILSIRCDKNTRILNRERMRER